jgi:hypothetical protein
MIQRRIVLMENEQGDLGAISVAVAEHVGTAVINSYDSRCGIKTAQASVPLADADAVMNSNIRVSVERGWRVFYHGAPMYG